MIAQEAKFELLNYKTTKQGVRFDGAQETQFIDYIVKLTDADGEVVRYSITDYYNKDLNEITSTKIWVLEHNALDIKLIENDSRLGNKILSFITNEHFYRGDVLESMYVKEQYELGREDRLNKINDSLDSFFKTGKHYE